MNIPLLKFASKRKYIGLHRAFVKFNILNIWNMEYVQDKASLDLEAKVYDYINFSMEKTQ